MKTFKKAFSKKTIHMIVLTTAIVFLSVSCDKNEPKPEPVTEPVIYVAGYEKIGMNSFPVFWKDGEKTQLPCNSVCSKTSSIFVSGEDIYIVGNELENSNYIGKIWKNGVATILSNGGNTNNSYSPFSIYVDGSDVYVAGVESGEKQIAILWKNGEIFQTYPSLLSSEANSVFVSNGVVYAVGYKQNSLKKTASLWKDGEVTSLSNLNNHANAKSLFVTGNIVYVAGYQFDSNGKSIAYVWMVDANSVVTPISLSNGDYDAQASSIFVSGADVYVAGYEFDGGKNIARLWKNNVLVELPLNESISDYSIAESVYVLNNDVFVVGYGYNYSSNQHVAIMWKNGVITNLSTANNTETFASSVFVK